MPLDREASPLPLTRRSSPLVHLGKAGGVHVHLPGRWARFRTGYWLNHWANGQIKSGKLKALGVTSARRAATAPELPTIAEAGIPKFDVIAWMRLFPPAGTPAPIVSRLESELEGILKRGDVREKLIAQTAEATFEPGARFSEYLRAESRRWAEVIRNLAGKGK